ncbi:glycosyltransferase family 4 protein [Fuerstiella marisgermanici]|uniref:Putative glycosyl transferase n=1 Tax=Fuerstiella marisgermanici TaxID=1891926 RepID=A0A1P8WPD7_9PLAN|nr:glycosyltransferase family 4 protein [Fuerstiella marisgermanici]APZ95920.1 putative glycosyl transferase [Fuerstiella marisgermanici]
MRTRVLFINRSYWPDSEATGQLLTSLCEGLSTELDVHVLVGQPNIPASDAPLNKTEVRHGVTIHRVGHLTFPKRSMVGKAMNFISFVLACHRRIWSLPRPDIVVFETDPFLLPLVASRFARKRDCRLVGYLQDIYPDIAVALGKVRNNWLIRRLRKTLFKIYKSCDRIVVLSEDMKTLIAEGGIDGDRISVIPNWADTNSIRPIPGDNPFRTRNGFDDKFVVMYSGNMGLTQRLEQYVYAAEVLKADSKIQFVFVGNGANRHSIEQLVSNRQLDNVCFFDYQPLTELSASLGAADLHILPLTAEISRCLMPSKLYGILAAGRPYLTTAPAWTELSKLTVKHQIGFRVDNDAEEIAETIRFAAGRTAELRQMGKRARKLGQSEFSEQNAIARFLNVVTSLNSEAQAAPSQARKAA